MANLRFPLFSRSFSVLALIVPALVFPLTCLAAGGDPAKSPPAPVVTALAVEKSVAEQTTLVGTAEASAESTVAAEVSGLVIHYPVDEGDKVEKGRVLARLNTRELTLQVKRANAQKARIFTNLELAKKELDRVEKLKRTDAVALRKYDEAFYAHQALMHELDAAEADLDLLDYQISRKTIPAPFSGFVSQTHTEVGQWVGPGGAVATILRLDPIRVKVDLPERYAVFVKKDEPAVVRVPSVSDAPFDGRVTAILPRGNPDARTFPVHIEIGNPDMKIKDGMEAAVTLNSGANIHAVLVPKDAVVTAGDKRMVYVVENSKVQPVPIQVLGYYQGFAAIKGPVRKGDEVVIRGNERLRPGQEVKAVPQQADGSS